MKNIKIPAFISKYFHARQFHKLGVSAAVIKDSKQILLIRRENEPFKDRWCFPGGNIENNERYLDATKREILEETGVNIRFPQPNLLKVVEAGKYTIITSITELDGEQDAEICKEKYDFNEISCRWFNFEDVVKIDEIEFVPGIKQLIPEAFEMYKNCKI